MKLGHVGSYVFDGTMADLGRIDQANPYAMTNLRDSEHLREQRKIKKENEKAVEEVEKIQKKTEKRSQKRKALKNKK